jgi:hypothetical protein
MAAVQGRVGESGALHAPLSHWPCHRADFAIT